MADGLIVEYPNDTLIDTCFFQGHGGQAIALMPRGTDATVRDCWMRDCKRGVRAENIHHLTLHGNQTRSLPGGQVQQEHVYLGWSCREIRIVNNHLAYGGDTAAIVLDGTAQHVLANNTIEGFKVAIEARGTAVPKPRDHCRDIVITANYLHADIGVHLCGPCRGFAITGNDFINNREAAILIEQAAGAGKHTITGNIVRKSVYGGEFFALPNARPLQGRFRLGDAADRIVSGNLLEGVNLGSAIQAGPDGGGHVITANRIIRCKGVAMDVTAKRCEVEHNLVT